jgi:REP element-mobilizing transposase RayT
LEDDRQKRIIIDSLQFLTEDGRIWIYGFAIMPNHLHLLWRKQEVWMEKNIQQIFLKYTAQKIKFSLIDNELSKELGRYESTQGDRIYHFWERRAYKSIMPNRQVVEQKLDYIHNNPMKAGLCENSIDYEYSSARYYELNEDNWGFITHYADHI